MELTRPHPHDAHTVHFYSDEGELTRLTSRFVRDAVAASHPAIAIVTAPHVRALLRQLQADGVAPSQFEQGGLLWIVDAEEMIESFMRGGVPDARLFETAMAAVLHGASPRMRTVRAFGEMVDVLWKRGRAEAALHVEALWNRLAHQHAFSLLCAYDLANFHQSTGPVDMTDVCAQHATVR